MRYLPLSKKDREEMLSIIGVSSQDNLYDEIDSSLKKIELDLPLHETEQQVKKDLYSLSRKNISANDKIFFMGGGCYRHEIPEAVDYIIQRSEFLTSYTPYQPEISQGTLAVIFEFQSMIASLTGMEVSNASLYDGATSVAEAVMMAKRITRRDNLVIGTHLNPNYESVLNTYIDNDNSISKNLDDITENTACLIIQTPDFYGTPHKLSEYRRICDEYGVLLIVVISEIISLGMLPEPHEADIVVGEAHSLGSPMNFGGPHLGFLSCRKKYLRQIPGRICGKTIDKNGNRGFVLTLNAREQHIRREKATSNICSNQGLNIVAFTAHLALLGAVGLKKLARLNHYKACKLYNILKEFDNIDIKNKSFFNEFVFNPKLGAKTFLNKMLKLGVMAGIAIDKDHVLITATELNGDQDFIEFEKALKEIYK